MNNEDYKIAYENVMIANKMLEQENKELKKRNKEIYEGFMVAIDEVCDTDREKREYKSKIDKAIEYIQNHQPVFKLNTKRQLKEMYDEFYKNILEILGDKENE